MRPGDVVEGLKEHHASPHVGAILTEARALAHQRRQSMTQGEVETLKQTGADREPQFLQALGTAAYPGDELLETALLLLLDYLAVDQLRVGLLKRLLSTTVVDRMVSWFHTLCGGMASWSCGRSRAQRQATWRWRRYGNGLFG